MITLELLSMADFGVAGVGFDRAGFRL